MLRGPPCPLLPGFPLRDVLPLLDGRRGSGIWLRGAGTELRLHIRTGARSTCVVVAGDLGRLLRCCSRVLVREGTQPALLPSELLLQWRALQVVTATPYLAWPHGLQALFPGSELDHLGFRVPLQSCPPEVVLAECLARRIPVSETRIVYCTRGQPPSR